MENIDKKDKYYIQRTRGADFPRFMVGRGTVGTTRGILSDYSPSNLVEMTTATDLYVASTSAADTAAGTGMRTVVVRGLDANWNLATDVVALNGTTAVALPNVKLHPFVIIGNTVGSGLTNAGVVNVGHGTFTSGTPANVVLQMAVTGWNQSRSGVMPVPAGYDCVIDSIGFSSAGTVGGAVFFEFKFDGLNKPWLTGFSIDSSTSQTQGGLNPPTPFIPEKSLMRLSGLARSSTLVLGGYAGLIFSKRH